MMAIRKITNDIVYREGFKAGFDGRSYFNLYNGDEAVDYRAGWTKGTRQRAIREFSFLPVKIKNEYKPTNNGVKKKISVSIK